VNSSKREKRLLHSQEKQDWDFGPTGSARNSSWGHVALYSELNKTQPRFLTQLFHSKGLLHEQIVWKTEKWEKRKEEKKRIEIRQEHLSNGTFYWQIK